MKETKTIQIEVPANKKAEWQEVDGKTVLVMVDEKDNRPVTERIKTFEDACNELGEDNLMVRVYQTLIARAGKTEQSLAEWMGKDVVAFLKLRIITEALNEGWHPKFTEDEYRYYPWFYIYTKEEYDNFSEEEKRRCVGRAYYYANANGGLVYSYAHVASSVSYTNSGVRLAFSTRELAEYAGKQFIDIWADFVFEISDKVNEKDDE
jgi:hypothetical protein